jgi:hypothetical protein
MSPQFTARYRRSPGRGRAARRRLMARGARGRPFAAAADRDVPDFGSAVRRPRLRRVQRQVGLARRTIGFWAEQLERTRAGLQALEAELGEETGEEPLEETGYEGEYDTSVVEAEAEALAPPEAPAPPIEGEATPVPPSTAAAVEPDRRVLFNDVFDRLAEDEFTEDFYPRVDAVNRELAARGEPTLNRSAMHPLFDRYLHDRIAEGQVAPPARWTDEGEGAPTGKPRSVTDEILFQAFRTLGPEDMTADKQYPLVAEVRARLPGTYEAPSQQEIHAAWERFKR